MSKVEIRVATPKDGEALLNIYKWYIENTAITFAPTALKLFPEVKGLEDFGGILKVAEELIR